MPEITDNPKNDSARLARKPRQLSRFICQEMLYDYMNNTLDEDRRWAVEQYLSYAPDLQTELKLMKLAEEYCGQLAKTRASSTHLEELKNVKSFAALLIDRLRWVHWPETLRWATQSLLISFLVAMIALVIPWSHISFKFPKRESPATSMRQPQTPVEPTEAVAPTVVAQSGPESTKSEVAKTETPKPSVDSQVAPVVAAKAPTAGAKNSVAAAITGDAATVSKTKTVQLQGLLYRLMMTVEKGEELQPEITEKLIKLGAEKAGQVDLGWRKDDPPGSYYHMKMPEANYDELIKTLGAYGPVRIYKNPHERVMPPGEIRIILFIEDKK